MLFKIKRTIDNCLSQKLQINGVRVFTSLKETSLLSAGVSYITSEEGVDVTGYKAKTTDFSLNTSGLIDELGFKIYLLY